MKDFRTQYEFINKIKDSDDLSRLPLIGQRFVLEDSDHHTYNINIKRDMGYMKEAIIYEAVITVDDDSRKRMFVKEFYPALTKDSLKGIRDSENPYMIHYNLDDKKCLKYYENNKEKFVSSYKKHVRILDEDERLIERIVNPRTLIEDDDYIFALYDTNGCETVDRYLQLDIARIINILRQVAETIAMLHEREIIYMDLKPANILYNYDTGKVRLFDLDAAVYLDELSQIKDFFMPSEKAYIPPEFRKLADLNSRKHLFISEEVDLYMLGVTLFYLIMGRYPEERENEDMAYLENNIRQTLATKTRKKPLSENVITDIVELLQESLAVFRYLSVDEFKEKLDEISESL